MALNYIFDPIFFPLINFNIAIAVIIISFILALTMTVIYKLMTDQDLMKQLKGELKEFQKEIKELKEHPEQAMKVQKRMMETNMKYMMNSMKPTFVTFIPIILIFGWLSSHLAFMPVMPNTEFTNSIDFEPTAQGTVTIITPEDIGVIGDATKDINGGIIRYRLMGLAGEYTLEYKIGEKSYTKDLLISNNQEYKEPIKSINDGVIKTIKIDQEPLIVMNILGKKQGGFFKGRWGWLGTYIVFSIIFSMSLRKLMKLH
jgi:uncharacterized membrane protein (DUF106 family)